MSSMPNTRTYHEECLSAAAANEKLSVTPRTLFLSLGMNANKPRPVI